MAHASVSGATSAVEPLLADAGDAPRRQEREHECKHHAALASMMRDEGPPERALALFTPSRA